MFLLTDGSKKCNFLLKELLPNEYKRVASNPAGVLKGEVTMLTILWNHGTCSPCLGYLTDMFNNLSSRCGCFDRYDDDQTYWCKDSTLSIHLSDYLETFSSYYKL